ncbi:bifunctional UDP-N-acetylglucosamine diphosphorylase/glucosamine-1-phosphate N-acetyltransferase GlmU [Endozoicomonas sp. SM1973]|uniref:Bifunctional protein GlmU n=1 Tax=Spartinivicinus marinus TaxID=2994442 RepID=A0A853HZV0_9GAMM|nr:bifunctional UDP-N-acetylglucosamine diphosphorylase/glucosamine-1-phosphate N-acetyltransferase GlmU [Spartinivicinus marinus]MCX4026798.1 bifunctional UDP-N-acetylglucosamine diphosphorylase/glucosamine-1-phosphate N-acetyltransferase GlmU [Spartinivicinus marinus]NYZ64632.1 bifunctional UDP-N-acetylglucosamine diphosphorylase/glucosamine-1-phosphate N-acetyltransferase GlmU [Spartinivicinus marinus]
MKVDTVILAAGQGTRMKSNLPKVLHEIAKKPMLAHVIEAAQQAVTESETHVVIGHGSEQVKSTLSNYPVSWVLQEQQLGTGHAVHQAIEHVASSDLVLILYGDVPLLKQETIQQLINAAQQTGFALLTVTLADATGYGRIVRNSEEKITAIVEHKDASSEQLAINEINTGIMAVNSEKLQRWLPKLSNDNAQGEYYLTDIVAMAVADGMTITAVHPTCEQEVEGVNNKVQLAKLERWYQQQLAEALMIAGATLRDPNRVDIRGEVTVGKDVIIDVNAVFEGNVTLSDNVTIEPNCILKDCQIGSNTIVKANSIIEDSVVHDNCDIGPFARLRPGTELAEKAKVGNFVETKKTTIGAGSKVNHLSYVGDAEVGAGVNIGAGTITCNYDGANKFKTTIEDNVFIGSNTSLVAPVTVSQGATTGAGSTITKNVPANELAIGRARQTNLGGWQRPTKKS